jgi:anti-anti-sigma factor
VRPKSSRIEDAELRLRPAVGLLLVATQGGRRVLGRRDGPNRRCCACRRQVPRNESRSEFPAAAFDRGDSTTLIEVRGRLDAESAGTLQKPVLDRVRRSAPHVVLDLTAVTFLHGVEILVGTRRLAALLERSPRTICRDPRLITLLRAANLHPSLEDHAPTQRQRPDDHPPVPASATVS